MTETILFLRSSEQLLRTAFLSEQCNFLLFLFQTLAKDELATVCVGPGVVFEMIHALNITDEYKAIEDRDKLRVSLKSLPHARSFSQQIVTTPPEVRGRPRTLLVTGVFSVLHVAAILAYAELFLSHRQWGDTLISILLCLFVLLCPAIGFPTSSLSCYPALILNTTVQKQTRSLEMSGLARLTPHCEVWICLSSVSLIGSCTQLFSSS